MGNKTEKKVVLIIVDGFGLGDNSKGNAITLANTPNWDNLSKTYPWVETHASGNHVGLPDGVMGNSEVGHFTIGTGRITYQSLEKINKAIREKKLSDHPVLQEIKNHLKTHSGRLHLMGLLSDGKVHSDQSHLHALIDIFQPVARNIFIHGFTDGRDTPTDSSPTYIRRLKEKINDVENVSLSTIIGRYYVMDRDKKWDRTQIAYKALLHRNGEFAKDAIQTIEQRYSESETDEFLKPVILDKDGAIKSEDVVLFFNFRPDRARQITQAIVYDVEFGQTKLDNLLYVTMTRYDDDWDLPVIFDNEKVRNSLAEVISDNGIRQVHIAETEKYAHVTYFLNGGIEEPFNLEDRILVPSPRIETYDLQPEMSTEDIVSKTIEAIQSGNYPVIILNIACPDMVGHTGIIPATIKAVETMDDAFGRIHAKCMEYNYTLAITADHGNAEKMLEGDEVHTAHTTNKVPFLVCDEEIRLRDGAGLKNVAPTLLEYMGIPIPHDMDGGSLLRH